MLPVQLACYAEQLPVGPLAFVRSLKFLWSVVRIHIHGPIYTHTYKHVETAANTHTQRERETHTHTYIYITSVGTTIAFFFAKGSEATRAQNGGLLPMPNARWGSSRLFDQGGVLYERVGFVWCERWYNMYLYMYIYTIYTYIIFTHIYIYIYIQRQIKSWANCTRFASAKPQTITFQQVDYKL